MAHSSGRKPKREYGTGCLIQRGRRWAIRWREPEIGPDGTRRQVLRYESLGSVTRQEARSLLAQRLASRMTAQAMRSCVPFKTLAEEWRKTVVPMYKHSTQKNHRHVLDKHLIPWFGDRAMHEITRQEVQGYVAHLVRQDYAPRSIDHIHDVLSAVLRTAVKWGHLNANPAREVDLPKLRNVRPKWAMSVADAKALVDALPLLPKTMVALALLTGLRRGELFALRWRDLDEVPGSLVVREAVYEGQFDTPKTDAGVRQIPLSESARTLLNDWRAHVGTAAADKLVFATWSGKPISPNNVARQWIFPACDRLNIRRANWLTFRRTYCSWAHDIGVPAKVLAQLLGHTKVDTTLNVYTQVLDGALRAAATRVGDELFTIVHNSKEPKPVSC